MQEAKSALRQAQASYRAGDAVACRAHLDEGLALAPPGSALEAQLRVLEVRLTLWDRPVLAEARDALRRAQRADAPVWEAHLAVGTALFMFGEAEAVRQLDNAVRYAPTRAARAEAHLLAAAALHMLGRLHAARTRFAVARSHAARARRSDLLAQARFGDAHAAMMVDADYPHAIRELTALRLRQVGLLADDVRATAAIAHADAGDDEAATAVLDEWDGRPNVAWGRASLLYARAEVEWAAGRLERAVAVAAECASLGVHNVSEPALLTRGWARLELGHAPDLPATWSDLPLLAGQPADAKGLQALADGRPDVAYAAFIEAARLQRRLWIRNELRSLLGAAHAAEALGDLEEARRLRRAVARRARRFGIQAILRRLEARFEATPLAELSARQRQVIELVAGGASSAEIAVQLGLSRATVEAHIRAVMKHAGARTRIEAAARLVPRARPESRLAPHEQRIVDLLATGATVTEAALLLHVSRRTLTRRLARIRAQSGLSSTVEVVLYGLS